MGRFMKKCNVYIKMSLMGLLCLILVSCQTEGPPSFFINLIEGEEIATMVFWHDAVYAGGMTGVFRIDPLTLEAVKLDHEFFLVKGLVAGEEGLYIGHERGVILYDGDTYQSLLDEATDQKDVRINTLYRTQDKTLWAGSFEGVLKLTPQGWQRLTQKDGLRSDTVYVILQDPSGGMIFGHYATNLGGLSYWRDGEWQTFTSSDGLPHDYITAGLMDQENIYLATGFYDLGGIAILKTTSEGLVLEETIRHKWGEHGYKARSLYLEDEVLWVGTEYNGFCKVTDTGFIKWDTSDGLVSNEVKVILKDSKGRMWLGTKNGISVVQEEDLQGN